MSAVSIEKILTDNLFPASNWGKLSDLLQFLKTWCYTIEIFKRIWNILNWNIENNSLKLASLLKVIV